MGNKDRGSNTHGHGSSKKQRGAGSRGGRGKAGRGKKAKHKKLQVSQEGDYLGEKGFKRPGQADEDTVINVQDIDQKIEGFVEQGYAEETDDGYVFHADDAGFDKVLGGGRLTQSIEVHAPAFSASAEQQIGEAGGDAVVTEESA